MQIVEHIDALAVEGERFLDAARAAGLGAAVPSCPGWAVADMVRHLGAVHRWATAVVTGPITEARDGWARYDAEQAAAPVQDLTAWFGAGHGALLDALRRASSDDECWRFSRDAPSSLAFWARRQAHETAIHRADAEEAGRSVGAPFGARFAADGIDEMLAVFVRRRRDPIEPPHTFLAVADDIARRWHVTLGAEGVVVVTDPDPVPAGAQLTIDASADALYRLVWNRLDASSSQIRLAGDGAALEAWHAHVAVT